MHRRIVDGQVQQSTDGVTWVNIADLTDEQLIARLTDEQLVEIEHEQRLTISVEDEAFLARHVPALLAEIRALKTKLNPPRIEWLDDSGQVPWPPKEGAVSLKNSEVILHVATELMKGALSNPSIGLLQLQTRDLLGLVDQYPSSRNIWSSRPIVTPARGGKEMIDSGRCETCGCPAIPPAELHILRGANTGRTWRVCGTCKAFLVTMDKRKTAERLAQEERDQTLPVEEE